MAKTNTCLYNGAGTGSSQLFWKKKTYIGRTPRKGKTSPLLFPRTICYSMSSYFGSVREGLSQLLFPNPDCYNAELTEDGKTRHPSTAIHGCLLGKTIKLLLFVRGTSCLISRETGPIGFLTNRHVSYGVHILSKYEVTFNSNKFSPGHGHWTKPNFILSHKKSFRKAYHENFTVENVFMQNGQQVLWEPCHSPLRGPAAALDAAGKALQSIGDVFFRRRPQRVDGAVLLHFTEIVLKGTYTRITLH